MKSLAVAPYRFWYDDAEDMFKRFYVVKATVSETDRHREGVSSIRVRFLRIIEKFIFL